ncbi:hypothetical protein BegalDRAFT_1566 [Beggiatoa alba B18LD]|uniref:Uncharacterized protein n=1 Tax=Beggiatoa alba B18LD TaxID=395493 RepID=I3CFQ3_9GAMM|nr:hypothetical protein [Beggiatoa alba]EIJ42446.1 hypothetical protein BegalDRAFT_1566 [Beggiatoa alba B18LD]
MKTIQINLPDDVLARFEKVAAQRGADYTSVNSDEVKGKDALFTDLIVLGLDDLAAGEEFYPDDVETE